MQENSRTRNTIRNTSVAIICQCLRLIFSFACRIVFVKYLAEVYLGVDGLFANILGILSLAELGMGSALEYELFQAVAGKNNKEIASVMKFYKKVFSGISIAIAIVGLAILPFVDRFVQMDGGISESVYVLYALYLLNTVISYFYLDKKAIICAYQETYIDSIAKECAVILQDLVQCIVLALTRQFVLYLIIQVIFTFLYNQTITYISKKRYKDIWIKNPAPVSDEKKHRMIENVKALFVVRVSNALVTATDNIIITALCGLVMTGLNSNYTIIMSALNNFAFKFRESITPSLGNLNAAEEDDKKERVFYELQFGYFWLYLLSGCGFILLAQDVVKLCFGERYLMDFSIVVITGVNFYIYQMQVLPDMYKSTLGLFKYGRYMALTTGIINIILSVILGRSHGVFGILLATFISKLITEIWYTPYIVFVKGMRRSPLKYYKKTLLMWVEVGVIWTLTCLICNMFKVGTVFDILIRMVVCIVIPNLFMWVIHHNSKEYKALVERIMRIGIVKKLIHIL